jgi:hypothetical protein
VLLQPLVDLLGSTARLFKAARSVYGEVCVAQLLFLRHLCGDARLGLLAREAVA